MKNLRDGMYGFIVADALGVPVEFNNRKSLDENPVTDMRSYGTYNQPVGTWSDDSSMTLCTYDNIVNYRSLDDVMQDFLNWYQNGYMTPHGECFDIGMTTQRAILNYSHGINPIQCGLSGERDNGNGALMRMLPLVYYKDKSVDDRVDLVTKYAELTHAHKRNIIACVFYVEFAILLLKEYDKSLAYNETIDIINKLFVDEKELLHYQRLLNDIQDINREQINSTGYVVDTIEAVIWAFLTTDNYKECVLKAVNLGGDTDTISAISGGLAGIYYGYDDIPSDWINNLQNKKLIEKVLGG